MQLPIIKYLKLRGNWKNKMKLIFFLRCPMTSDVVLPYMGWKIFPANAPTDHAFMYNIRVQATFHLSSFIVNLKSMKLKKV